MQDGYGKSLRLCKLELPPFGNEKNGFLTQMVEVDLLLHFFNE